MEILLAVTAGRVFEWLGLFVLAIIGITFIIVVHEGGHYLVGRWLGFEINEFAVGIGPKLLKVRSKKRDTAFSLRLIPMGGYCAFREDDDDVIDVLSFESHSAIKRIAVFIAGGLFNMIVAILLFSVFFMTTGDLVPVIANSFEYVDQDKENPLKKGDVILEVDGKSIYAINDSQVVFKMILEGGNEGVLTVLRDGSTYHIEVTQDFFNRTIETDGEVKQDTMYGYGFTYKYHRQKFDFFDAIGRAFPYFFTMIGVIFETLFGVVSGALNFADNVGGPATAVYSLMIVGSNGVGLLIYALAVFSAMIGVTNLLPLPSMDGSKIVFTVIEVLRRKPVSKRIQEKFHFYGVIALVIIMVILDLIHFLG